MSPQTPPTDERTLAAWVERWKAIGPILQQLDRERTRYLNLACAIELLDDAFEAALRRQPLAPSSGLVTQQRILWGGPT